MQNFWSTPHILKAGIHLRTKPFTYSSHMVHEPNICKCGQGLRTVREQLVLWFVVCSSHVRSKLVKSMNCTRTITEQFGLQVCTRLNIDKEWMLLKTSIRCQPFWLLFCILFTYLFIRKNLSTFTTQWVYRSLCNFRELKKNF